MRAYFASAVGVAAVLRIAWFGEFLGASFKSRRGQRLTVSEQMRALRSDLRLPRRLEGDAALLRERHELYWTQQVAAYTLGGLSLAAWSILASGSGNDFSLGLLTVSVLASLSAPIFFRSAGGEWTRMGYESGLAVAGLALILAMIALAEARFESAWITWAAWVVPAVLLAREIGETVQQAQLTSQLFVHRPPLAGTEA